MVEHRKRVTFEYKSRMPRLDELDASQLVFDYDGDDDTLYIHFYGGPRPAISVLTPRGKNYGYVRVDPETEEVVGIEIECFVSRFLHEDPGFISLAEVAGVPEDVLKQVRQDVPEERWKKAAIGRLFGSEPSSPMGVPV